MDKNEVGTLLNACQDHRVPANRRPVPKEQRREELLAAAAQLFVQDGYEAASMTRIAKLAGVTANTLYWYFDDKDQLLVAVADAYLRALLHEHRSVGEQPLADQLLWLVQRLRPVKHLVATVHDRQATSDVIGTWHRSFHAAFETVFETQLQGPLQADTRDAEVAAATFALEGAITHPLDDATTSALCHIIADRLQHAAGAPPATVPRPAPRARGDEQP